MNSKRLKFLKEKLLFILEFMAEKSMNAEPLVHEYERLKSEVNEAFNKSHLARLETYNKSFNDLVRNIPELKKVIDLNFNETTDKETNRILEKIEKKSSISNDIEYEIVKERVDKLCQTESDKTETEKWNELLLQFEKEAS